MSHPKPLKQIIDSGMLKYKFLDPALMSFSASNELKNFFVELRIAFDRYSTQMLYEAEQQEIGNTQRHTEYTGIAKVILRTGQYSRKKDYLNSSEEEVDSEG